MGRALRGRLRGTHVVDIVHGVRAMIPNTLFTDELRRQIGVV